MTAILNNLFGNVENLQLIGLCSAGKLLRPKVLNSTTSACRCCCHSSLEPLHPPHHCSSFSRPIPCLFQLLSASSVGQRTLARVSAADTAQLGQELRSELLQLKQELEKLQTENVNLQQDILKEKESATQQLAAAKADAEHVIQELRRVVGELEGQLKQQVGTNSVGVYVGYGALTLIYRKLKF